MKINVTKKKEDCGAPASVDEKHVHVWAPETLGDDIRDILSLAALDSGSKIQNSHKTGV